MMHVSYHGHSVVKIETKGKTILIDPFITGNELTDLNAEDVKVDVILLTHGHNDHVGDTVEIAKRSGALVVAVAELATYLSWQGLNVHPMSIGGAYTFDFGTVKLTQAFHGSSYTENNEKIIYTGMPAGLLLTIEGKTIYHAGDTALFSDLKLIGRHEPDVAFLPIGDNFTMGPEDAAIAAEWVQAKLVVPIHYNTFPVIKQDPHQFVESLSGIEGKVLKVGEGLDL
ncbi:metal-dependent hydrolase [Priestia megaterium]|jgi:L-ascorbate metabolism protein UlaG (beta-lactamase superfamily)|nr:L-ascorbate metabolism protein UlaG (beta-lactamase superfamily) [Priestia megaterium]NER41292.1 metal-dependent hydrolase [Priestia megaterium NBRC 15308 = ATCC 14581]MDR4230133.1 metal-dependent hydrolase [Priestia megaterium]PAK52734.1 metal-dependent hydrolase [Priestia megaterium]QCY27703.1 metal-dependent hydrolase [Priestia megaterium NBRC 15308 = ATCC 14581]